MTITVEQLTTLLDSEKFSNWLQEQNTKPFVEIGVTRDAGSCPIANYIKLNLDLPGRISVDSDEIEIFENGNWQSILRTDTPPWAKGFIDEVDEIPDKFPQYETYIETYTDDETGEEFTEEESYRIDNVVVTAGDCINILNRVLEKLEEEQPESFEEMNEEYNPFSVRNSF